MIAQLVTCHLCSRGAALTGWSCLQGSIFSQNILVKKLSVRLSRGQLWGADFVFLAGVQLYQQWWEGPDGGGSRISAFITRISLYKPNSAWITLLSLIHWSEQQQQPGCDRLRAIGKETICCVNELGAQVKLYAEIFEDSQYILQYMCQNIL